MKFSQFKQPKREVIAFIIVGIASTITHFATGLIAFYVLPLGLSALWANLVAFSVAFLVTYFGNALHVFPKTKLGPASFFRFLSVSLFSLFLNQSIVFVLVDLVAQPYWLALIVVLAVVPPITFIGMKIWGVRGLKSGR